MFSDKDRALIFKLVEELTGASQTADTRQEALANNLSRRIQELGLKDMTEYMKYIESNKNEHAHLISNLTIHTTSWFRENPHFVAFQEILLEAVKKPDVFKVWCAACSTGEEVYSFALMLEEFRRVHPKFDYRVYGTDIDAVSLVHAERAIYPKKAMNFHVIRYKNHILEGSGKTHEYFTLTKEIRKRCLFRQADLRNETVQADGPFQLVVCRNVLIYFTPETVGKVIPNLLRNVRSDGYIMLGHSESIQAADYDLSQMGHSLYSKRRLGPGVSPRQQGRPRVLAIDESSAARRKLLTWFNENGFDCHVVSSASEATAYLNFNVVNLITMDIKLSGISADKWLNAERDEGLNTPVVVLSDLAVSAASSVVDLLSLQAQDYVEKRKMHEEPEQLKETFLELIRTHSARKNAAPRLGGERPKTRPDLVLIGASTGGPQALVKVLDKLPPDSPPIVITQHMAAKFTRPLADRLAEVSGLKFGEVGNDTPLLPGHIYLATGDYHLGINELKGQLTVSANPAAPFNGHRPSVDFMFNSAMGLSANIMGILLTGMGRDGALGLRFLRKEGAYCVAQSEEDCVVFGMPREAIEREAADFVGNLDEIRLVLLEAFGQKRKKSAA